MKIVAMIQARMGSTRFPGKALAPLEGKPVLSHVIERAKELNVNEVVLLTSCRKDDDVLEEWARTHGIECFRKGNIPLIVLPWYERAAHILKPNYIIRVCGDQPLLDVGLGNALIRAIRSDPEARDYYSYRINGQPMALYSHGVFVEAFKWPVACYRKPTAREIEHVTIMFYRNPGKYRLKWLEAPEALQGADFKATIDTVEDLRRVENIFEEAQRKAWRMAGYREILRVLKEHPEWAGDAGANLGRYGK